MYATEELRYKQGDAGPDESDHIPSCQAAGHVPTRSSL